MKESQDNKLNVTLEDDKVVSFCDEHDKVLPDIESADILYTALTEVVDIAPCLEHRVYTIRDLLFLSLLIRNVFYNSLVTFVAKHLMRQ